MGWLRFASRLILLPSFAGLLCWGCSAAYQSNVSKNVDSSAAPAQTTEPGTGSETSATALELTATDQSTPIAAESAARKAASAAAYREGINLASSAYVLSQSAFSPDDWGLIASRWQRAATVLASVSTADENYDAAQQKISDYTRQNEAAIAKIASLRAVPTYTQPIRTAPARPAERPAARTSGQRVSVPIVRRLQGTPVVRVTFRNGSQTKNYEMILDTGASRTLITRRMASELGVVTTSQMVAATASATEVTFDVGSLDAISIGEIELPNAQVSIGESVRVGLLGNDFLRGYDLSIQTRMGRVELVEAN